MDLRSYIPTSLSGRLSAMTGAEALLLLGKIPKGPLGTTFISLTLTVNTVAAAFFALLLIDFYPEYEPYLHPLFLSCAVLQQSTLGVSLAIFSSFSLLASAQIVSAALLGVAVLYLTESDLQ